MCGVCVGVWGSGSIQVCSLTQSEYQQTETDRDRQTGQGTHTVT